MPEDKTPDDTRDIVEQGKDSEQAIHSLQQENTARREEAIHALAADTHITESIHQKEPRLATIPILAKQRRRLSRRSLAMLAVALVIVLVAVAVTARNVLTTGSVGTLLHPAPTTLRLDLNALGYSCPSAMAWSPDGSKLAVLAQRGHITPDQDEGPCASDTILVFDAQHGILLQHFDIAAPLKAADASLTLGSVDI